MKLLKQLLIAICLLPSLCFASSACDKTKVLVFNETKSALRLINIDRYGSSKINGINEGDTVEPSETREIEVSSGTGTMGGAAAVLTFVNNADSTAPSDIKFIALDINLTNTLVNCKKRINVRTANNNKFEAYVIPGYENDTKIFIVGQ